MNYYEHHLGDYAKKAGHLSMIEDGAYRRLLDVYYSRERALPADVRECCKLARASTKPERDAVAYVLREFFVLADDGHHHKRCDEEIAKYQEAAPDREAKKENQRERQRRARARRSELFDALRGHGIVPAYDATTGELESQLSRATSRHVTPPVTRDDTATQPQTPDPSNQSKALLPTPDNSTAAPCADGVVGTPAGHAAAALNRNGLRITSQNPNLIAACSEGITTDDLLEVQRQYPDKPAGYVIAAARRIHAETVAPVAQARAGPNGAPLSKTAQAFLTLEGMKSEHQLDPRRNPPGAPEAALALAGPDTGK